MSEINHTQLKPKQIMAAKLLSSGSSIKSVAEQLEVSYQTIYNWKSDPHFKEAYKENTKRLSKEIDISIRALSTTAVESLAELLNSKNDNVRLKAIQVVLEANGLHKLDQELYVLRDIGL